jgi:hypothetical protein
MGSMFSQYKLKDPKAITIDGWLVEEAVQLVTWLRALFNSFEYLLGEARNRPEVFVEIAKGWKLLPAHLQNLAWDTCVENHQAFWNAVTALPYDHTKHAEQARVLTAGLKQAWHTVTHDDQPGVNDGQNAEAGCRRAVQAVPCLILAEAWKSALDTFTRTNTNCYGQALTLDLEGQPARGKAVNLMLESLFCPVVPRFSFSGQLVLSKYNKIRPKQGQYCNPNNRTNTYEFLTTLITL